MVVGEGRLDSQTGQGKIIAAILARAGDKPVYAVVGSVDPDLGDDAGNFAGIIVAGNPAAMGRRRVADWPRHARRPLRLLLSVSCGPRDIVLV